MNPFLARNALKIALAVAAVLLAVVIGFESNWGAGYAPPAPSQGTRATLAEAKLLPALPNLPAEQAYPETGARPLFTPVRRPAPAGQVAGSMVKGQFQLSGVIMVDGHAIAMLKERSSGKTVRIEKGKEVNGITVANIERDRVTLKQGEDSEVIALLVQRGTATPGTAFTSAGPFTPDGSAAVAAAAPATAAPSGQPPVPGSTPPMAGGGTAPAVAPAARAASSAVPSAAPGSPAVSSSAEDLLARSRARRAQRFQEQREQREAANPQNVQK